MPKGQFKRNFTTNNCVKRGGQNSFRSEGMPQLVERKPRVQSIDNSVSASEESSSLASASCNSNCREIHPHNNDCVRMRQQVEEEPHQEELGEVEIESEDN